MSEIVEEMARAICYWADPAKNGTCHDNFCVGSCRAITPDKQHYDQAQAAYTIIERRMSELEGCLRDALDMVVDGTRDGTYSVSEFQQLRAALNPTREASRGAE